MSPCSDFAPAPASRARTTSCALALSQTRTVGLHIGRVYVLTVPPLTHAAGHRAPAGNHAYPVLAFVFRSVRLCRDGQGLAGRPLGRGAHAPAAQSQTGERSREPRRLQVFVVCAAYGKGRPEGPPTLLAQDGLSSCSYRARCLARFCLCRLALPQRQQMRSGSPVRPHNITGAALLPAAGQRPFAAYSGGARLVCLPRHAGPVGGRARLHAAATGS